MPESRTQHDLSAELRLLLADLRAHPHFPLLLKEMPRTRLKPWKPSGPDSSDYQRFIYDSGQVAAEDRIIDFLSK